MSAVGTVAGTAGVRAGAPVSRGRHAGATAAGAPPSRAASAAPLERLLVQPASLVIERRHRPGVEDHRAGQAVDQGSARSTTGCGRGAKPSARRMHVAHHLEGHRRRLLEDAELAIQRGVGVGVLRVEADLLTAAQRQDHPAKGDQRPDGVDLVLAERTQRVEGADGRQRVGWGEAVVMQQGGDGDGDLVHGPGLGDVPEVDDGIGQRAGRTSCDHVVVGDVEVPELTGQARGHCIQPALRRFGDGGGELAHLGVGLVGLRASRSRARHGADPTAAREPDAGCRTSASATLTFAASSPIRATVAGER